MTAASISRIVTGLLHEVDAIGAVLRYEVRPTKRWSLTILLQAHGDHWHLRYESDPEVPGKPWRAMESDRRWMTVGGSTAAEALDVARGAA